MQKFHGISTIYCKSMAAQNMLRTLQKSVKLCKEMLLFVTLHLSHICILLRVYYNDNISMLMSYTVNTTPRVLSKICEHLKMNKKSRSKT